MALNGAGWGVAGHRFLFLLEAEGGGGCDGLVAREEEGTEDPRVSGEGILDLRVRKRQT